MGFISFLGGGAIYKPMLGYVPAERKKVCERRVWERGRKRGRERER